MGPLGACSINRAILMILVAGVLLFEIKTITAAPHPSYLAYYPIDAVEEPNADYQTIARLRKAIDWDNDVENSKRGLDLGLGRGFSGSLAAKHLMGLAAAQYAGGPGRRRRSTEDVA